VKIHEVVPEINRRSDIGRVVISPPSGLKPRVTKSLMMCCNRAFLTDESYKKHLAEKSEHSKPVDPSKFPKSNPFSRMPRKLFNQNDPQFWIVRKKGNTLKMVETVEEDPDDVIDDAQKILVTNVDNSVTGRGKWKKCEICSLSVMGCNMRRHKEVCHSGGQYNCEFCPCVFVLDSSRKMHQNKMHRVRRLPADSLKKAILARAKQQLVSSKASKNLKKSRECLTCGKLCGNSSILRDHLNIHSGEKPYSCECGSRFGHRANLQRHIRVAHPKNSKYFCKICDYGFSSNISLGAHKRTAHSSKLKTEKSPKIHKVTPILHPTPTPNNVLPQLKLQYPSPNKSNIGHMLIHSNLKPYKCKLCGIYFRLHGTMHNHLKMAHSKDGRFPCGKCTCRYTNAKALHRHIRQYHKGTTENELKTKLNLSGSSNDENTDEISPNFKCDLCGMLTNEQNLYKDHLLLHSEVSKHQCDLCLKVFTGSRPVIRHKEAAHGKGLHKCYFCCCRYGFTQGLIRHLTNEHGMERGEWNYKTRKLTPEGRKRIQRNLIQTSSLNDQQDIEDTKERSSVVLIFIMLFLNCGVHIVIEISICVNSQPGQPALKRKFACNICFKGFNWKGSVFNHKKHVHGIGGKHKYQCPECPLKFKSKSLLDSHKVSAHDVAVSPKQNNHTSDVDSNLIQRQEELNLKSQLRVTPEKLEKKYECNLCFMKFINPTSVSHHKKKSHFHNGTFKCNQCCCKFTTMNGLIQHRVQAHGYVGQLRKRQKLRTSSNVNSTAANSAVNDANINTARERSTKKFYCNKCGKFIIGKIGYRVHVKSHSSAPTYKCDLCQMQFFHRSSIFSHKKRSHFHDGDVQCPKCPCKFLSVAGLANHQKHHHKLVGKTVLTKQAATAVSPNSKLSVVENNDDNDSSNQSNVNDEVSGKLRVTDQKNVEVHLETYDRNQDKQYECNLCNARFQHKGSIAKHKRTAHFHTGKYKCPDCICKFLTPNSLVLHRKNQHEVNMGELKMLVVSKPSVPKLSAFKKAKKILSQSRDQDNVCDICGLNVRRKTYLKTHKQIAHSNGIYRCNVCCCRFRSKVGLASHMHHHANGSAFRKQSQETDNKDSEILAELNEENQTESYVPVEETSISSTSSSPLSKVNRNFLKIRGSALSSKRQSSSTPSSNSPVKASSAEPVTSENETELVYPSKPPRGSVSTSAYRYKCNLCGIRFTQSTYVDRHMKKAHTNGTSKCDLCNCSFESNIGLAAHKRVYHNNSSIPGAIDNKNREGEEVVPPQTNTDSIQSPDSSKIAKPSQKSISFVRKSRVKVKCSMCHIGFSERSHLKRHMKQAHTDGSFRCPKCCCSFLNVYALSAHKRVYHNSSTQGKGIYNSFLAKKKLKKVKSTTNGAKSVEAKKSTEVGLPGIPTTNRTSTRIRDKMDNNIDKPTVQQDTPISENGTSTLLGGSNDNDTTIDSVTPTPSPSKKVSFKKPQNLVKRKRVRKGGDRRFPCTFCTKVFSSPGSFARHVKCHTRPEACTQCSMRFRTRDEVVKHVTVSHGDGEHQCYICTCRFTSTNGLKMHMKLIHERQSASYDDIVIEQDEDVPDNEPPLNGFLPSSYSHSMQDDEDDFIEDSVPIIDGMIETTYSIATDEMYYREIPTANDDAYNHVSYSANDENFSNESEPIIQGILTFNNSHVSGHQASIQLPPPQQQKRKAFSPKSRPMKCSTCSAICYGPEKLRQHMESHTEGNPLTLSNGAEIEAVQCSKCYVEFDAMSDLMQHLQVDHDPTGHYKCVYCVCSMKTESALQSHFMKYHSIRG
ncbi:Zinc finger protein-likeXfin, partial [Orchesella cincta]